MMKPVARYFAELDDIKAPDSLTQKLLAIPAQYPVADATIPETSTTPTTSQNASIPQSKKAIRFTLPKQWKKYACTAAACFAFGVFSTDALGWQVLPHMGTSASDNASYETGSTAPTATEMTSDNMILEAGEAGFADSAMPNSTITNGTDTLTTTRDIDATAQNTRKIIYNTRLTLESKTYDETLTVLNDTVSALDGYLEYSEHYTHNTQERWGSFTYRVPATNYSNFIAALGENGNITYISESANDVTTDYLDLEARVTTLTQQRDRLWELQAQAESLTDLLEIETALTDVLYQIESYQTKLNYLGNQVDYATICINLTEVIDYTITEPSVWDTICTTFTAAMRNFVNTIGTVLLFILSIWVWIALALVGVFVYHRTKRKKANKNG